MRFVRFMLRHKYVAISALVMGTAGWFLGARLESSTETSCNKRRRKHKVSTFKGPQGRGAMRLHRRKKREEAEARNAQTLPERRRQYRIGDTK